MFIRVRAFKTNYNTPSKKSMTSIHKEEYSYEFTGEEYFLQMSSFSYFKPIYIDGEDKIYFGKYYDGGGGLAIVDSLENLSKASEVDKSVLEAMLILNEVK